MTPVQINLQEKKYFNFICFCLIAIYCCTNKCQFKSVCSLMYLFTTFYFMKLEKSVFKLNLTLPEIKKNDFQSLPQSEDCMLLI